MTGSSAVTISSVVSDTPGRQLVTLLGCGRQLGAHHEQLALQPDEEVVELGATLGLGPGEARARRPLRRPRRTRRAPASPCPRVRRTAGPCCRRRPCACRSSIGRGVYGRDPASTLGPMSAVPDPAATRRRGDCARHPRARSVEAASPRQDRSSQAVDEERPRVRGACRGRRARPTHRAAADAGRVHRLLLRRQRHVLPQRRQRRRGRSTPPHQAAPPDRGRRPRRAHGPDRRGRLDPRCRSSSPHRSTTSSSPA